MVYTDKHCNLIAVAVVPNKRLITLDTVCQREEQQRRLKDNFKPLAAICCVWKVVSHLQAWKNGAKPAKKKLQFVGDLSCEMAVSAKPSCFNAAYFGNAGLQANHTLNSLIGPSRPCIHPRLARPWFAFRKHAEDLRNVSTESIQSTFFILVCVLFYSALHSK